MYQMLLAASFMGSPDIPKAEVRDWGEARPHTFSMAPLPKGYKSYRDGQAEAKAKGLPLVVFVGVEPFEVRGAVSCWAYALDNGTITNGVVVAVPDRQIGLSWRDTLPGNASEESIRRAAGLGASPSVIPFFNPSSSSRLSPAKRTADDEWLKRQLPFLAELEPYETASRVQYSERRNIGYISSYPRDRAEAKWNVPGGLEGVTGWSSELFRRASMLVFLGRVRGDAITWQPLYLDGDVFADVLRNEVGTVFEVRVAERVDGVWDRYVAYRDARAFPPGYVPIRRGSCQECHANAGDALYGNKPAVPGGDGIFSNPIPQVESGATFQDGSGVRSINRL